MNYRNITIILPAICLILLSACTPKARYDRMLKKELSSGVRYDSLFMGLYFGMPEKDFYMHCWRLNQKGLIKQGETNTTVLFEMKSQLKHPAWMDFYPRFNQGRIYEMPVRFYYQGWAPWNKELLADNLQAEVLKYYEKTYGKGFIEVKHPVHGSAFVKINGNRRITLLKKDDRFVWAIFTDLTVRQGFNSIPSDADRLSTDTLK